MKKMSLIVFLLLAGVCFCRAQGPGPGGAQLQITPAVTRLVIDSLGQVLKHNYVFPDTAAKMAAYLDKEYKRGAYAGIKDPQELADRLWKDLEKAHHDGHLRIMYAPGMAKDLTDTVGIAQRRRVGDSIGLIFARQRNFAFNKVEILSGNIGYVKFNGFVGYLKEARPTFSGAFRFVANTRALIIDMRDNGGGSPAMVCQVASYFFGESHHWNDIIGPRGKSIFYVDPKDVDGQTLSMPVYILTSRRTFSGGEDFCYGMKSLHRATIVGDTTGGGAHPVGPVPVVMGFVANVPFSRSLNPYTQTDWEGTGVYPDIPVKEGMALERARQAIFADLAQHAATEEERRSAQWQLDDLTARQPQQAAATGLAAYTGTYQGLTFYVDHGELYCKNEERGGNVFKMIFISGDKWVLDENVHVEFRKDEIEMLWIDGRVSKKKKSL
ncbi:MAG: S41 family peptidase [Bacteroidetes bacterium]|nr:S41 family peptidase [Bacteroidota bacterium]